MNSRKAVSLIGLSMKAGKIASGEFATEKAVKQGTARLVVAAEDCSGNTRKKFENMCAYYHVPFYRFLTKEEMGKAIGREYRACLAVLDENLAGAIEKQLNEQQESRKGRCVGCQK